MSGIEGAEHYVDPVRLRGVQRDDGSLVYGYDVRQGKVAVSARLFVLECACQRGLAPDEVRGVIDEEAQRPVDRLVAQFRLVRQAVEGDGPAAASWPGIRRYFPVGFPLTDYLVWVEVGQPCFQVIPQPCQSWGIAGADLVDADAQLPAMSVDRLHVADPEDQLFIL